MSNATDDRPPAAAPMHAQAALSATNLTKRLLLGLAEPLTVALHLTGVVGPE